MKFIAAIAALAPCLFCTQICKSDILIGGFFSNNVISFSNDGSSNFTLASCGRIDGPTGLVVLPSGDLIVSSWNTNELLRFDLISGEFKGVFSSDPILDGPGNMVIGPDNRLYVGNFGQGGDGNAILRFDENTGQFIDEFVSSSLLVAPDGISFGTDGRLYVVSTETNEVLRFDGATGEFIDVFVADGEGGLDNPTGITFGPNGNLYVSSFFTNSVLEFDDTGVFIQVFASRGLLGPRNLIFDSNNQLLVANGLNNSIARFDINGIPLGALNKDNGGIDGPIALIETAPLSVNSGSCKWIKHSEWRRLEMVRLATVLGLMTDISGCCLQL